MLRRLYDWTMSFAAKPNARWALAGVSFAESSFFPVPPDVLLIPMVLANRMKAWEIALICMLASVAGGILGYAIGALLYETVGTWLVNLYGLQEQMASFRRYYTEWGVWIILIAGFTPIPYKVFTIASGLAFFNLPLFILFSAISRGGRFFLVAGLLYFYGEPIRDFIERRLEILTIGATLAAIGGFVIIRYGI